MMVCFTQYLRPDGRKINVVIDRSVEVSDKALLIKAAGLRLECEVFADGLAHFTITDDEDDQAHEIVKNGPDVPEAVDRLILGFDLNAYIANKEASDGTSDMGNDGP